MSTVHLLDRLLAISALLQSDQERELGGIGLTIARTHVLWVIAQRGASTQADLAQAVGVTPRNITALVDALVSTGFVIRSPHPTDRRAVHIELTAHGAEVMRTMAREHDELDAALSGGLAADVARSTAAGLDHVYAQLTRLIDERASEVRP